MTFEKSRRQWDSKGFRGFKKDRDQTRFVALGKVLIFDWVMWKRQEDFIMRKKNETRFRLNP